MSSPEDLRDRTRQQILDSMGGWSGTIVAAIPLLVFVIVNAVAGLRTAVAGLRSRDPPDAGPALCFLTQSSLARDFRKTR